MRKNQRGFSVVELLIVLLVIVVTVAAGWYVWQRHGSNANKLTSSNTSSSSTNNQPNLGSGKIYKIDASKLKFDQAAATTDTIGDRNGPFYHDVYTATSTDGIHFTATGNKIISHASVPDAIRLPSGQIVFYAVDGASRSMSAIVAGVSSDNGKNWQLGSVHVNGVQGAIADPQVTMSDSGQLRLFVTAFSAPQNPGQPSASVNKIDSYISSDGINFSKESGDRFAYSQATDPDIVKIGSTWFLYVAQGPKLLYATSSDGYSFTYKGVIRDNGSVSATMATGGGKYHQFYCGSGQHSIMSEDSSDGINWQNQTVSLASSTNMICDPSVVEISPSNWLMIYKVVE